MDKVLVTGVDELIGANIAWTLADRCEVLAVSGRGSAPAGCRLLDCSVDHLSEFERQIEIEAPRAIVHCGAFSRSAWDLAQMPLAKSSSEFDLVRQLAELTEQGPSRLIVICTDGVFAGPRMFHPENARAGASGRNGEAALAIEQALAGTRSLLIRTHAYGWSPAGSKASYAERIWNALSAGDQCDVDAARHATPILASDLAEFLYRAMQLELEGVLHIAGAERTSMFRFAAELAAACGFAGRQVRPIEGSQPRHGNVDETSLNTQLVRRQLGMPLPLLREGLMRFAAQARVDYREKLTSGILAAAA